MGRGRAGHCCICWFPCYHEAVRSSAASGVPSHPCIAFNRVIFYTLRNHSAALALTIVQACTGAQTSIGIVAHYGRLTETVFTLASLEGKNKLNTGSANEIRGASGNLSRKVFPGSPGSTAYVDGCRKFTKVGTGR